MTYRFVARLLVVTFLALASAGLSSCYKAAKPRVGDFDTYQIVRLGPAEYVTPDGVKVTKTGPGFVEHQVNFLPNSTVRVEVDPNPPRDFKFDADAEKRRFLDELDNSYLRSAQYSENDGVRRIRVFAEGTRDEQPVHGILYVIRQQTDTATIRLVGPRGDRVEINRLGERLADAMKLEPLSPAEERGLKASMPAKGGTP
jgi:hypothetical protein